MNNQKHTKAHRESRGGFALLILLVAVAILLMLYAADLSMLTGPLPRAKKAKSQKQTLPWDEEHRLGIALEQAAKTTPQQPVIDEAMTLKCAVTRKGNRRGDIAITIRPNGQVDGNWRCSYTHEKTNYRIEADFAGNLDPTKVYTDQRGQADETKLFFITKGNYRQDTNQARSERVSTTEGVVYVTGWIEPELSAFGQITITTDKSWHAVYVWRCQ